MNDQVKQFKLYIPSEISSDCNLTLSEMKVLATIKALDNSNNCFASNSYLSECLKLSVRQISRLINVLKEKGYIIVENYRSFKRKIKVVNKKQSESTKKVDETRNEKNEPKTKDEAKVKAENKNNYSHKKNKFTNIMTRKYDFDALEELEALDVARSIGAISEDEYVKQSALFIQQSGISISFG